MLKTERVLELDVVDRGLAGYLARVAGKGVGRFCSPSMLDLQSAAATYGESPAFIRERLQQLVAVGRIEAAVRTARGEPVSGYIVLPERLWRREKQPKLRPASSELSLSANDCAFLKSCGIATD